MLANIVGISIGPVCYVEADFLHRWQIKRTCGSRNRNGKNKDLVCSRSLDPEDRKI